MSTGRRHHANLRFTSVHLENWRNFSYADVELSQRVFVVGPNASGKPNLLDVFRFLHDIVSVGGGLEEAVRKRQGISKLRALAARKFPDIVIRVDLGGTNGDTWQYELALGHDKQQRPRIVREAVRRNADSLLRRPDDADASDPARLTQTYLQQVNVNKEFPCRRGTLRQLLWRQTVLDSGRPQTNSRMPKHRYWRLSPARAERPFVTTCCRGHDRVDASVRHTRRG